MFALDELDFWIFNLEYSRTNNKNHIYIHHLTLHTCFSILNMENLQRKLQVAKAEYEKASNLLFALERAATNLGEAKRAHDIIVSWICLWWAMFLFINLIFYTF